MIYEVVATHILFFYFIESSYSIATVLSVFLFGLAIGSISIHYLSPKINNKKLFFAIIQIIIAIYALIILSDLTNIIPSISTSGTFITSFLILLIPTFFLGAVFPLAGLIYKKEKKEIIGLIYSSDLFGAIIGSILAGFILIPIYGAKIAVIFGGGLNLISAFVIIPKKYKTIPIVLIVLLVASTINFNAVSTDDLNNSTEFIHENVEDFKDYQYYSNSPYGVVTVKNNCLSIGNRAQCCFDYPNTSSEIKMADYSLDPLENFGELKVLNIGLGCACTLNRCLSYDVVVDVVEINEKVVEANRMLSDVLDDPHVNLIINDGLSYMRSNSKIYDAILIDIENPTVAHASNLYTVDAFLNLTYIFFI